MHGQPIEFRHLHPDGPAVKGDLIVKGTAYPVSDAHGPMVDIVLDPGFALPRFVILAVTYTRNRYSGMVTIGPNGFGKPDNSPFPDMRQVEVGTTLISPSLD